MPTKPPVSQNGYSANDRAVIATYTVPGTALKVALRKGDVSVILIEFLRRYNIEVEPLTHTPQDLWGYAERTIRGSTTELSNHASGTAVDVRATAHPLAVPGTFTPGQVTALRRLLADFTPVLRWGGDYTGRVDEMHIEVVGATRAVKSLAERIRTRSAAAPPPKEDPMTPEDRRYFDKRFADLWSLWNVRADPAVPGEYRDRLTDLWDAVIETRGEVAALTSEVARLRETPR